MINFASFFANLLHVAFCSTEPVEKSPLISDAHIDQLAPLLAKNWKCLADAMRIDKKNCGESPQEQVIFLRNDDYMRFVESSFVAILSKFLFSALCFQLLDFEKTL